MRPTDIVLDKELGPPIQFDPRFPNQNQNRRCYQNYLDFHRCAKKHNENFDACRYFKRIYEAMCPSEWVERWDEQVEAGKFAGRI